MFPPKKDGKKKKGKKKGKKGKAEMQAQAIEQSPFKGGY